MAKRHAGNDTSERARGRRYATGEVDETHATDSGDGEGWRSDDRLARASIEDLWEFADELEIDDYESLTRDELVRAIQNETRADPGIR